jgi:hypothetical protein
MYNIEQKVNDLKLAVAVNGEKLVSSKYTDKEIEDQFMLIMNQKVFSVSLLLDKMEAIVSNVSNTLSIDDAMNSITSDIYELVGWDKLPSIIPEFWYSFGSAPFTLEGNKNKKLDPKKGHKGMDDIFDNKFDGDGYNQLLNIPNFINSLESKVKKKFATKKTHSVSEFRTVDAIEEELPVKKAKEAAEFLFNDKTIQMSERLLAFEKYGEEQSYIYNPENRFLNKIFDIYQEMDYCEKHEIIYCHSIIEWWIYNLQAQRCFIDYSKNRFHPKIKKEKRNYTPSKEAIKRLSTYYTEILISEGVSKFEFDW